VHFPAIERACAVKKPLIYGVLLSLGLALIVVLLLAISGDPESPYCDQPSTWVATAGRGHSGSGTFRAMVEEVDDQTLKAHRFWVTCSE
jgi:hypothetical protein